MDAEDDIAIALERYSADQLRRWSASNLQGISRSDLAIDMFLSEGQVNGQSILDIFAQHISDRSENDRALIQSWKQAFNGLFVVLKVEGDRHEVMNWLTEKRYWVTPNQSRSLEDLSRLSPGEIIVTRLWPETPDLWTYSGPLMLLGKLGKPKLAVAIGNFKNWFPNQLYGDALELLEEAWISVERYHQYFVEFFGTNRMTLPGHELDKQLKAYQEDMTQRRFGEAGIDASKSLKELVNEAGFSEEDLAKSAGLLGEESGAVNHLLDSNQSIKMVMPPISLPEDLRRAEAVTVFVHPRWGQAFLKDYARLTQLFESTAEDAPTAVDQILQKYLKEDAVNTYVWHCIAEDYPQPLTNALRRCLNRPSFILDDLDDILASAGKPLTPTLPEIASVPTHLQTLFEEALQDVTRRSSKKKAKDKSKQKSGFGSP
ncbi:hypothetical protein [Thermoleptolyngbya sp.]